MREHLSTAAVLLLPLLSLACDDPTASSAGVVHVSVSPADTLVAPGDSAFFTATALGEDGQPRLAAFTWHSSDGSRVRVGEGGRALAVAAGDAVVEARASNGVRGFALARVRNVTLLEPSHGAFGAVVRIAGAGFGTDPRVLFGGVEAEVREVSPDARRIEAWVPLGAGTGVVSVIAGVDTFATGGSFYVTGGGDDALEPNGYDAPLELNLPFRNPALVARPVVEALDADLYRFRLDSPSPLSIRLTDASAALSLRRSTRVELFDVERRDIAGLAASVGARGGPLEFTAVPLLPIELAVAELPAGTYDVLVTPFSFLGSLLAAGDRGYELRIDDSPVWTLPPDGEEPNDNPGQAPVLELPSAHELAIENAWAADYFLFDVGETADVTVAVRPLAETQTRLDLWLMSAPAKSIPWIDATGEYPDLYLPALVSSETIEVGTTLRPGRYVIAVLDGIGAPTAYRLELRIGAAAASRGVAGRPPARHLSRLRPSRFPPTPEGS